MVLVTGASGFLGRHLVQYLSAQGIKTRALYRSHPPHPGISTLASVEWRACDLLDVYAVEEAMTGITEVYHCAALISYDKKKREEMLHFNHDSTANVVNEALLQNVRKMVHVSSVAAIGRTAASKEITEEEEWGESRYNSAYGISKYISEMEVWRGIGEGLNAVIVNPSIILGDVEPHSTASGLMKLAYNEFPFYAGGITGWVDVNDVVRIMVQLMNSDISNERFIVSGGNCSYREMMSKIAIALHKKPPRYPAGKIISGLAWRLGSIARAITGAKIAITRETANTANATYIYNNSKLLKKLPDFSYTPIDEAVNAMARSFMNSYKK